MRRSPARVRTLGAALVALAVLAMPVWAAPAAKSGDGTLAVSPATTTAGSTGDAFAFSFRNINRGPFNAGSQFALSVPAGWSAPQSTMPDGSGYVDIVSTSGTATASILSVSGTGPWTVIVNFTAAKGPNNGFDLGYAGVVAPAATGIYAFAAQTMQSGGTPTSIGSSPSIAVAMGNQTISFSPLGDQWTTNQVGLGATANSGLAVGFSVGSGPAILGGGTNLVFTGPGVVSIVASQAGDANWNPASPVTQTFAVAKALADVELDDLDQSYDGLPKAATATTAPAGLAVQWTYDGGATAPTAAGFYAVTATVDDGMYQGAASGTLVVAKAAATVVLEDLAQTYDGLPKSAGATTVPAGLAVDFTYDGSAALPVGAGTYAVAATVVDANYAGLATGALVVAKANASPTLENLEQVYDGTPRIVTVTTDPPGLDFEMTYDGAPEAPIDAGSYEVVATVVDPNYEGSVTGTLVVAMADQTIDFPPIGDQLPTNAVELSATASSGLAVGFSVASGPARIDGTTLTFTGAGTVVVAASQPGDGNWNAAPAATNTFDVRLALVLNRASLNVREGSEARFFVRLDAAPASDVEVAVERSAGDAGLAVQSPDPLVFTPANWSAWKPVTLEAAEDGNAGDETATFRISTEGVADGFVEATALDDDIGENIALLASSTTISGSRAGALTQAIDGISDSATNFAYTIWTGTVKGYLTLDLQVTSAVARIRLLNWDRDNRYHRYAIESSADGTTWSSLVDASAEDRQGWDDWAVSGAPIRYLKFTGLSNSVAKGICIPEWEVYGARKLPPRPALSRTNVNVREAGEGRFFVRLDRAPQDEAVVSVGRASGSADLAVAGGAELRFNTSNWNEWQAVTLSAAEDGDADGETATFQVALAGAPVRFVSATALDGDIGANLASIGKIAGGSRSGQAIDGVHASSVNYAYMDASTQPPGALQLDLKAEYDVARIRVLNWDWSHRVHRYSIESSVDGTNWSSLVDASGEDRQGWDEWAVEAKARYLKFTGLSNSANRIVCMPEWEVYGPGGLAPQLEVSSAQVNVRENGEGRFFVRLDRMPARDVAVAVARSAGDEGLSVQSGGSLAFTPANWSAWQAVTLAEAGDEDAENETATFQVSLAGAETRFVAATALDDDVGVNLAIAGRVTGGSRGAQAIDGIHDVNSNYAYVNSTSVPPGTLTLDLKAAYPLGRIRILNWDWTYRVHRYAIESSADGVEWTPLVDASGEDHQGWDEWTVDATARFLRLTGLSNSANRLVCVPEWEVYGAAARRAPASARVLGLKASSLPSASAESAAEALTVVTSDDIAPVYESGWAALDGDPETAWVGQKAGGGYILVEFGPALELSGLEVDLAEGSLADVEYLYSADAAEWKALPEDLEANPVSLNFLWLLFPDDGTEAVPNVIEIRPNP
ncbi:MAG: MBG domain-containing protein [Kiritimatiellia bacterium]